MRIYNGFYPDFIEKVRNLRLLEVIYDSGVLAGYAQTAIGQRQEIAIPFRRIGLLKKHLCKQYTSWYGQN